MFRCARCEKLVDATTQDPVVATSKGYLHYACFRADTQEKASANETRREAVRARRKEAGRRAWAKRVEKGESA